jgi:L-alanine-DL-glutamate epimerase-like enolase superfamily enzyme
MHPGMATTTAARELTVGRAEMRFASPLRISGYIFDAMPSVLATITDAGKSGRGEAAGVYYLGDDQDRMIEMIEEVRPAIEGGLDREQLQSLLGPCGARNALDCALWDLQAKLSGIPVWALAGLPRPRPLVTVFTLPADEPPQVERRLARLDFAKAIKLKLDGVVEADRDRLATVRAARPDVWLSVDANQGYAASDLDALARMLSEFSVALVEQPAARGDEAVIEGWRPGIPVAADESIIDLTELRERGAMFDVINIKLDKCGGLTEALAMVGEARSMGKLVMIGNMGGSTLAMAPGFVLGQVCDVVDLDGPYGLAEDALAESIYSDGEIFVSEEIWGGGAAK